MQKLSTAATVAATETMTEKWINFVNLHFFTYNTVGTESLCRAESLCRNTCISYFRHFELR
jgi:hypothetical protein